MPADDGRPDPGRSRPIGNCLLLAARDAILDHPFALRSSFGLPTDSRMMTLAWLAILLLAAADVAWFCFSRLSFASGNFLLFAIAAVQLTVCYFTGRVFMYRLAGDPARIGRGLLRAAEALVLFSRTGPALVAWSMTGVVFVHLATSAALPLWDAPLARLDAALGFDWLGFLGWLNARPQLSWLLVQAYHGTGLVLMAVYVWCCVTLRQDRLEELLALLAMIAVGVAIGMALVPAAGAYAFHAPARELFTSFSPDAGMWHYRQFVALRSEPAPILDIGRTTGMVTFPSFHTALGIVTTYAVRDARWLAPPVLVVNALMIVATLPEGGHYLVDLIAGAAIAAAAILVARAALRRGVETQPAGLSEPRPSLEA
jgi:membrane-associated phospholipid phosphatase